MAAHGAHIRRGSGPTATALWSRTTSIGATIEPLNIPLVDSVIYEMHVRSFTRHPSSGVEHPGTFAGLIEKIPYLKKLGVTAVELLPVAEFEESDTDRVNPFTGEPLLNLWGYQTVAFFAPNTAYSSNVADGGQVREFRQMVRAMHQAGIEVILDVVFNHTAEGDEHGPTWSFRGIDNSTYYILDPETGKYLNYSGCGNTVNANNPVVRDFIRDCLHYWVMEMHVDGFRFDLASILGRGEDGSVLKNPPLLERTGLRSRACQHQAHRGSLGCCRLVPGRHVAVVGALGGMEWHLPRRGAQVRQRRCRHDIGAGNSIAG